MSTDLIITQKTPKKYMDKLWINSKRMYPVNIEIDGYFDRKDGKWLEFVRKNKIGFDNKVIKIPEIKHFLANNPDCLHYFVELPKDLEGIKFSDLIDMWTNTNTTFICHLD